MLYGIARVNGTERTVKVHLLDDKEDCSELIRPWEWGFFRGLFTHLGFEPSSVMVVSKGEYDRVAGSCARKGR